MAMRELPYLHRIAVSTPTLYPASTTNVYIFESQGQILIVDAGYENPIAANELIRYIRNLKIQKVVGLLFTHHHPDHVPGAKALAGFLKCDFICHPLEVPSVNQAIHPYRVTRTLDEGDAVQVGDLTLRVFHTPGHTQGHLSLWLEEEGLLVAGDNIVAEGTTWIGPPDGNLIQYLQTLKRYQWLFPKVIAPGHGSLIENPEEKIKFFISRRLEREQQILAYLAEKPRRPEELVKLIYANQVHPSVMWVAKRTIAGHLEKLVTEEKIRLQKNGAYQMTDEF
jgi:endoribonuclease LACTB2